MKIYDAFLFFNELELLEIRLEELSDVVDKFIICESAKTHSNNPKPLYFLENKDKFKKFEHKIVHCIYEPAEFPHGWHIENQQRNCLKTANFTMEQGDIFLLSDADEIMKADSVKYIRDNPSEFLKPRTSIMQMSYNFINTIVTEPWHHAGWRGTVILPSDYFGYENLNFWRLQKDNLDRYEDSGWHLSFLGGENRIKEKIEAYAHQEFNTKQYTDLQEIKKRISSGREPLGRDEFKLKVEFDLSKFPRHSIQFKHFFI